MDTQRLKGNTKKCGNCRKHRGKCADYVVLEAQIKNLKEEIDRLELELAEWKQQSL